MNILKYLLLLIPLFLSYIFSTEIVTSYFIAWAGSIWVFYYSLSGNLRPLPTDRPLFEQAMRPLVLPQIIFGGYMAFTSVFYFFDQLGYKFFDQDPFYVVEWKQLELMAECQRYYLTGHSFYVLGIVSFMNYKSPKYKFNVEDVSQFTLYLSLSLTVISIVIQFILGLSQIVQIVSGVSIVASILSLAFALPAKQFLPSAISGLIFMSNYIQALSSGWKEAIIVPLILLGTYLYQNYKTAVTLASPIVLIIYFTYVPTYNAIVRSMAWGGEMQGQELVEYAINEIREGNVDIGETNWSFLTVRLSEISMFTKYVESVPDRRDFYYFEIVIQALESIIPRVFFPNKPITEEMVMQRVIEAGVVSEFSEVSAKPAFIVDCYLSYGLTGVILGCFFIGMFLSYVSVKAESLFGGYVFGSGLFFTGLFMQLWRTNCFEFMANNAFWGYVFLFIFFNVFKSLKIVVKI